MVRTATEPVHLRPRIFVAGEEIVQRIQYDKFRAKLAPMSGALYDERINGPMKGRPCSASYLLRA